MASYLHRCGRTARAGASGVAVTLAEERDRPLLKALASAARGGAHKGALRERHVDPAAVGAWRTRLESLADALAHVAAAEREEALHRRADMEAAKAEHLLEHADDIAARPARSWFQSERDKQRAAKAATKAATRGGALGAPQAAPPKSAKKDKSAKGKRKRSDDDGDGEAAGAVGGKKGRRDGGGNGADGDGAADAAKRPSARDDPMAVARRAAALAKGAAKRALVAGLRPSAAKKAARAVLDKDAKKARRRALRAGDAGGAARARAALHRAAQLHDSLVLARRGRCALVARATRAASRARSDTSADEGLLSSAQAAPNAPSRQQLCNVAACNALSPPCRIARRL